MIPPQDPISHIREIFHSKNDETCIIDAETKKKYTYNSFSKAIRAVSDWMVSLHLEENEIIGLLMNNSVELIFCYFAALNLNLRICPIDPFKSENGFAEILNEIELKKIITNLSPTFEFQGRYISFPGNLDVNKLEDAHLFSTTDCTKEFLITFTSGSTGIPKGVVHSFQNLFLSAVYLQRLFQFNSSHVFYHNLPMTYMAGILNCIILPFISGSKIVLGCRFSVTEALSFWKYPIDHGVNVFWFIPTIVNLLVKIDRSLEGIEYALSTKIIGLCATAPLNWETKREFESKYNIELFESYGLSETLFVSSNMPNVPQKPQSVGLLLEGVDLQFAEDQEILIKVPWILKRYYNLDDQDYFNKNSYYKSGDIGEIDSDGYLFIKDRKKDLIIRGGMNISPKSIEIIINQMNIFDEFVVLGIFDEILGEKTVCVYKSADEISINLKKSINSEVIGKYGPDYGIDKFECVTELPKNINGKIDKITLRKKFKKG